MSDHNICFLWRNKKNVNNILLKKKYEKSISSRAIDQSDQQGRLLLLEPYIP